MDPVSNILQQLIIDLGEGSHPEDIDNEEWPVFATHTPDEPDNCIAIYSTGGTIDGRLMATGEVQEHLGFMLRVRSAGSLIGDNKINAIINKLDAEVYLQDVTLLDEVGTNGRTYQVHSLDRRGSINHLGKDPADKNRYVFTVNYTVTFD